MVSQIKDGIYSMFNTVKDYGSSGLQQVGAVLGQVKSAVIQKANDLASVVFNKVNEQTYVFDAAKKAVNNVKTQLTGMAARTAAKTYVRVLASDTHIDKMKEELRTATGSDALANTLDRLSPHLLEMAKKSMGEESTAGQVINDDQESCTKIMQAKILEQAIKWAKKSDNRNGEGEEHLTMSLLSKLLGISADHLENPGSDSMGLNKQFKEVADWLLKKGGTIVEAKVEDLLLNGEYGKNPELMKHVKEVAKELMANFGIEFDDKQTLSLESVITSLMNSAVKGGVAKLFFALNENLFNLNGKMDDSPLNKLSLANIISSFCNKAAEGASEKIFEEFFSSTEPGNKPVEDQKSFVHTILDKLFQFVFKWVVVSLGILDQEGNINKGFSWVKIFGKPVEKLTRHFTKASELNDIKDESAKKRELQRLFESILEDLIAEHCSPHMEGIFKRAFSQKDNESSAA